MSSGLGEIILTSTFKSRILATSSNYTITGAVDEDMNNTFLLAIILVLCIVILILLLFGALCLCFHFATRRRRSWKQRRALNTLLVTKSTSVTGLDNDQPNLRHAQVQVVLEGASPKKTVDKQLHINDFEKNGCTPVSSAPKRILLMQQKLITSTPTVKTESMIVAGNSGTLVTSPQSTIYDQDLSTFKNDMVSPYTCSSTFIDAQYKSVVAVNGSETTQPNFTVQSPLTSINATEWATGNEDLCKTDVCGPTSNIGYGTAHSALLQDNLSSKDTSLSYPNTLGNDENTGLLSNDCSFLESPNYDESPNSNGVTTSLPLDAYGHPRAWFVPLDELYHEPIRHSFIDVSSHDMKAFTQDEFSKDKGKICTKSAPIVGKVKGKRKYSKENMQYDVFEDRDDNEDLSSSWGDSGIPTSHNRVRSSNSSDSEGKKLSAWEQREDRPVLFLEERGDNAIAAEMGH